MSSRVLHTRVDTDLADPMARKFEHNNPIAWTKTRRDEYSGRSTRSCSAIRCWIHLSTWRPKPDSRCGTGSWAQQSSTPPNATRKPILNMPTLSQLSLIRCLPGRRRAMKRVPALVRCSTSSTRPCAVGAARIVNSNRITGAIWLRKLQHALIRITGCQAAHQTAWQLFADSCSKRCRCARIFETST